MRASQQIFRVRRQYNQWVNNQTLEDYALRFTAKSARRWSASMVASTALGAAAFMALEAIGGAITLNYGFTNSLYAILTVSLVILLTGTPICYYAAKHGLDIDLLTRGAGFGYLGSTITSLIYASFTFIFFAIEAAIMAMALKALFSIPLAIGYIICTVAVIPIVTHGITWISRFQLYTQPVWLTLQFAALFAVLYVELDQLQHWIAFNGTGEPLSEDRVQQGFDILLFGAAASVLFALVAQIGEQVDYLRFLPPKDSISPLRWWSALFFAGPGWIFPGIIKMLIGSFLAWLAFSKGQDSTLAIDPTHMYQLAFEYIAQSPQMALALAGLMVIVSQMKINVTNAYAGSIAWSNFFSRLTHSHPGRVVWLVFNVAIALLLMELGIYRALENVLGMFAIVAISWLGTLSADLLINKNCGLSPSYVEFKRAHLYDINPVGVGSMILSSVLGVICYLGLFGDVAQALAHFISLAVTFIAVPLIAYLTRSRFYIAREPDFDNSKDHYQCSICENVFEQEDMSHCPAYQGPICSLCCSLDARCLDSCKPDAHFSEQATSFLSKFMSASIIEIAKSRLGEFIAIMGMISLVNAGLLSLVYYHMSSQYPEFSSVISELLVTLFFILLIIFGILAWLVLLAQESRSVAQEESNRQTKLLVKEIDAHKKTDLALQKSKELADAANLAKSRYLTGISHELRTPLQSILGYAQILSRDSRIPEERQESLAIMKRSGEYLADLIEGLLDISRIEAGRLEIHRNQTDLHALLNQITHMFKLQAASRNIEFQYHCHPRLPQYINVDEKRLRQILINLLSNAVKFTEKGHVTFTVNYRSQVAEFIIEDSGVGISDEDVGRIFSPFERIRKPNLPAISGTGLGLTIVKLLCDIMGGDISVSSKINEGSIFKVKFMLSKVDEPIIEPLTERRISGFKGEKKTVMVVDDEPTHRSLVFDILAPLGFTVIEARNAESCLEIHTDYQPDIYLLDVSMPGMNGLELSKILRKQGIEVPIIMVSADAQERHSNVTYDAAHDAYLVKPLRLGDLLENLSHLLDIEWLYSDEVEEPQPPADKFNQDIVIPDHPAIDELISYAELGYAKAFKQKLSQLKQDSGFSDNLIEKLIVLSKQMRYPTIVELLKKK